MFFDEEIKPVVKEIKSDLFFEKEIKLHILRLDLIHPITGGNKLFKLKYNLQKAQEEKHDTLLTFGGAFSNHIAATAQAGKENGFKTIGIIRGEKIQPLNKTLQFAQDCGMQLEFVSREIYKELRNNPDKIWEYSNIKPQTKDLKPFIIPEGGNNELGIKGCKEILQNLDLAFDIVCCAVGTGTTLEGLSQSLKPNQLAIGISVSNDKSLKTKLSNKNCQLFFEYTFGSYGKTNPEISSFVSDFIQSTSIIIEPIYTGKLFFGIYDLIMRNHFKKGTTILAIHTGGLQYLSEDF